MIIKRKVYSLLIALTDDRVCLVSIATFPGDTSDTRTLMPQVDRLQGAFNLMPDVLVGNPGKISQKQIDELNRRAGMAWIIALKTGTIRKLKNVGTLHLQCLKHNRFEWAHPDFPGEKLVACRNPGLAYRRKHKREALPNAPIRSAKKDSTDDSVR